MIQQGIRLIVANIIGLIGLFGLIITVLLLLINFLTQRKVFLLIGAVFIFLGLFAVGTLSVPGEEEKIEEMSSAQKIYLNAFAEEKQGYFRKASFGYDKILKFYPTSTQAIQGIIRVKESKFAEGLFRESQILIRDKKYGRAIANLQLAEKFIHNSQLKAEIKSKISMIYNLLRNQ